MTKPEDAFTLDHIRKAMKALHENDGPSEEDKRLICYNSEADRLIAAGLRTEADIIRIKPLPV